MSGYKMLYIGYGAYFLKKAMDAGITLGESNQ
jgi:hypothetical protein